MWRSVVLLVLLVISVNGQSTYAKLLEQWKDADADLAELREARDHLKQH